MRKIYQSFRLDIYSILPVLFASMLILPARAQHKKNAFDSTYHHKNVIKLNLSPYLLYESPVVLSYERSVSKYQSFSITGGTLKFPSLGLLDIKSLGFRNETNASGYTIGGDYRFYFKKENKYMAPHGIYLGPYVNYFNFSNGRNGTYTDSSGAQSSFSLSAAISLMNVGIELGYQFVVWDRLTIDFTIIAPSLTSYVVYLNLDGNIDTEHKGQINQDILQALINRFPMLNKLISDKSITYSGTSHTRSAVWAPGLKFSFFLGYRFGK